MRRKINKFDIIVMIVVLLQHYLKITDAAISDKQSSHSISGLKIPLDNNNNNEVQSSLIADKFLEKDGELSKKVLGSSVATSISVILNGNEPQFTDAVGKPIPKPMVPLQVASPINLLNPDRYEFYTFDDNGELVKRLMTLKEIQSIVANGDGEGATILHNMPINDRDPEKNVHDIVASVQNVLTKEVEWKRNSSGPQVLDTPDVSASWSMILPTIFGNTGGDIFPSKPQQVVMTPDTDVVETSTKQPTTTVQSSTKATISTFKPTLSTTQKPKLPPRRRPSTKKPITTAEVPQKVFVNNQEFVKPIFNRVETTSAQITTKPSSSTASMSTTETPNTTTSIKTTNLPSKTTTTSTTYKPSTTHTMPYKSTLSVFTTKKRPTQITISTTKLSTPFSTSSITPLITSTTTKATITSAVPQSTTKAATTTSTTPSTTTKKRIPTTQTAHIQRTPEPIATDITTSFANIPTRISTIQPVYPPSPSSSPFSSSTYGSMLITQSNQMPTKISSTSHSVVEKIKPQIESSTDTLGLSSVPSQNYMDEEDDENTTLSINNIISSLTQAQEDKNTKLSFDQILQSLKDTSSSASSSSSSVAPSSTTTLTSLYNEEKQPSTLANDNSPQIIQNETTVHPVLYNGGDVLINSNDENKNSGGISMSETLENENNDSVHKPQIEQMEQEMVEDLITTTQQVNEIDEKSTSEKLDNSSNVVHFEPLYVEIKDPILMDITTTESSNFAETTNILQENKNENYDNDSTENYNESQTMQPEKSNETEYPTDIPKPIENYLTDINIKNKTKLSNVNDIERPLTSIGQEIENLISNALNRTQQVSINSGNKIKPMASTLTKGNVNMSDFKLQAATLASTLESSIQSTEQPMNGVDSSNEIEALLSDVLNQITDAPSTTFPIKSQIVQTEETSNRLSGLAQINSAIFISPSSSSENITSQLQQDGKFENIDTMSVQSSDVVENVSDKTHPALFPSNIIAAVTNKVHASSTVGINRIVDSSTEHEEHPEIQSSTISSVSSSDDFSIEITTIGKLHRDDNTEEILKPLAEIEKIEEIDESTVQNSDEYVTELSNQNDKEIDNIFIVSTTPDSFEENSNEEQLAQAIQNLLISDNSIKNDTFVNYLEQNNLNTSLTDDLIVTTEYPEDSTISPEIHFSSLERKEDRTQSLFKPTPITDIFNITETEQVYIKLGESTQRIEELKNSSTNPESESLGMSSTGSENFNDISADSSQSKDHYAVTTYKPMLSPEQLNRKQNQTDEFRLDVTETTLSYKDQTQGQSTLKPVQYYKQPNEQKLILYIQRPASRPPALSNLKVGQISQATRIPVKLDPTPDQMLGLEASTADLQEDIQEFAKLCNELAFNYWKSITSEKISPARSLILSPFALTSMLSMVFLGARGSTSGEMNEILKLDDMVTFNPHLVFKNITETVERSKDPKLSSAAFVREIFSDRNNGKILQFFKEKTQQFYSGHVEEVNFNVVNDIIRRRTNLLMKRHTMGKVTEYLRTNSVWVNGPLATVSANLFQTDCSKASVYERDGEMFFQVHPSVRQRRLVPIPAVVWRSGFTAGYDPDLDATVVAFGSTYDTVSTIFLMPGQQGLAAPGDNLDRLEKNLLDTAITKNTWSRLLTSLMERPGLEVQLPRFSHRSFINASLGLQKMGLKALFNSEAADLRGLTGSSHKDVYLSDMIQINTFSTCAEEKITDHHHIEMYPAPPLRRFNDINDEQSLEIIEPQRFDFGSLIQDNGRAFYDDLLDPKYLELPLPLRPRQARIPDAPRLRYDKPFLYFVRHNPTGMILFMGRFNPRLLP